MALIEFTEKGMYVAQAGVYIDPWRGVDRAIITHGHSDHARSGSEHYLSHVQSLPILRRRIGNQQFQGVVYGESININGVKFSLHPAGHVLGSSQVRVEYKGEIWVASGDYKLENDGVSPAFEPVNCHTFITESTFGLPVFNWQPQHTIMNEINDWWKLNKEKGMCSILLAYSLGKAQRILQHIDPSIGNVYVHGSVASMNEAYEEAGITLNKFQKPTADLPKSAYAGALVIAPSSTENSSWMKRFEPYSTGIASGWMAMRGFRRRMSADRGFVLSDHADWAGLNKAISATGASKILVTHGYTQPFSRWLNEKGLEAHAVQTRFTGESPENKDEPA
jgi:putative mRNA 3-end processing factor